MRSVYKKIVICTLLGVIVITPLFSVQALDIPEANPIELPIFDIDPTQAALDAVKVPIADTTYNRLTSPFWIEFTANKLVCDGLIKAAETNNEIQASTGWLGLGFGLIGGDPLGMTKNATSIAALTAARECVENNLILKLNYKKADSTHEAGDITSAMTRYETINSSLGKRIAELDERQSAETKDFMAALLAKIALGVTQNLTSEVVDGLIAQYKVSDYLRYADTLGTQLYTMNYINDNFSGNTQEQLMIRAIAQASFDNAPQRITVATNYAQNLAEQQTGCSRDQLSLTDPNFYTAFASSGSTGCTSLDHMRKAQQLADVAQAQGQTAALSEINTGQGFIPVRSCGEGLAQQQSFDSDQQRIAEEMDVIRKSRKIINQSNLSYEEINTELAKANAELSTLNSQLKTLGTQRVGEATKSISEAIESPGSFIAQSITEYLSGFLDSSMSLKSDNLPFALSFLGDLATNFVTDMITGIGDEDSTLLTEEGVGNLRSGTAPITFSQTFDPAAPLTNYGVDVPDGNPGGGVNGGDGSGGGGGGGGGNGGNPTQQNVCVPEADGALVVSCGTNPNNIPQSIGDIFNVVITFPQKAGVMELSSASLKANPTAPNGPPTIRSDGDPVSFEIVGNEEQPLREQFEVTSVFTIITVKFTPEDGSQILVASLAITLPELNNPVDPDLPNQGNGNGNVLGATDSNSMFRSPSSTSQKKSGITLR